MRTLSLALLHQDSRLGIFYGFVGTHVYTNKSVLFPIIHVIFDQQSNVNFIHSVVRLTTGPQPLPKRVLHTVRSSALYFNLQHPLFSSRSSSSRFRLLPPLPVTYIFTFIFPLTKCFRRQFLRKMWPIQLSFLLLSVEHYSPPWIFVTLLHFSHDRSSWSSSAFSNTTFQNFTDISDLRSEASKLQYSQNLYSKCSTLTLRRLMSYI